MSNSIDMNENKPFNTTKTAKATTDKTVVHSPKRRSLSSYLSKLHMKNEESNIKKDTNINKNEHANNTGKPSKQRSIEPLSEKIESGDILKNSIMNIVNEHRMRIEREENVDEMGSVQGNRKPNIDNSKTTGSSSKETNIESNTATTTTTSSNSHLTPFSREELKSVLKEPEEEYDSTTSESSPGSATGNHESNPNKRNDKDTTSLLQQEMINSDSETPMGSPIKVRRGRLIRGDKLQNLSNVLNYSTVYNDSDSELSDINDTKDLNINSSFLNSNSIKDIKESDSSTNRMMKPKGRHNKNHGSNNNSNSKGSRNKKSVYRDAGGRTRLQIACDKGKIDVVKRMLAESLDDPNSNIDVNDQDNAGNTPLHEAALNGHLEIVKLLVDHGANVNIQSFEYFKDTPLIDASANGHLEVVQYLLSKGADPTVMNAKGLTAYEAIEEYSDLDEQEKELVRDIKDTLRKGTQAWINSHRHNNNDKRAGNNLQNSNDIYGQNFQNRDNNTNGMNPDFDGNYVNYSNTGNGSNNNHKGMLSSNKINKIKDEIEFLWTDLTSKTGKEKLMQASKEGNLVYVGQYLENGGRIDFKAFIESVRFGHEDIASLFLAFGAQVNKLTKDDYTPLMVSVGRGHLGTVKLLLEAGADPTIRNKKNYDALYYSRNSPLGVVDDKEIELLKRSIKLHKETIESKTRDTKKERQHKVKEEKETEERDDKVSKHKNETLKKENKKKNIDKIPSSTSKKNDDINKIFDDDDDDYKVTIKKESERSSKNSKNENSFNEDKYEDENVAIPTSKYRHNSPTFSSNIQNKRSLTSELNDKDKHETIENDKDKDDDHIDKKPKYENAEREKERQERLKIEEEEYLQRKLENKRRKELELIQKLLDDEKKRVEEKEKQKLEEAKRLEQASKERELELERREKQLEIEKRRRIRSMYPLGLKLIKFNGEINLTNLKQIPIYYIIKDSIKYVIDLQLLLILRDSKLIAKIRSRQDIMIIPIIKVNERLQLWNILKPQFLFGDLNKDNEYMQIFYNCSLSQRLQFENEEYKKFDKLHMHWIRWDDLVSKTDFISSELKDQLEKNMTELYIPPYNMNDKRQSIFSITKNHTSAVSSIEKPSINTSSIKPDKHKPVKKPSMVLPIGLQHRYRAINLLKHEKFTECQPMW